MELHCSKAYRFVLSLHIAAAQLAVLKPLAHPTALDNFLVSVIVGIVSRRLKKLKWQLE